MNITRDRQISLAGSIRRLPFLLMIVLTGATLCLTTQHRQRYPTVWDSVGYMQASLQLADGKGLAFVDSHNEVGKPYYTLHAFKVLRPGSPNRYLDYPPGLPLLAAGLIRLTGRPDAVFWAVPLLATLLMAATCLVGYLMFDAWAGFWSGLVLFGATTFWSFATSLWSEIPSAALIYTGLACYLLAALRVKSGLASTLLAGVGGLVLGASFFVRFSNLSVLPGAVLFVLVLSGRPSRGWLGGLLAFVLAVGASLLCVLAYNTVYYGGPLSTSYTPQNGWYTFAPFALAYAFGKSPVSGSSTPALGRLLWQNFTWLLPFGLVGLVKRPRSNAMALFALSLCLLAPYAVYAFAAEEANSRFVVPALPAVCILIGRGLSSVFKLMPGRVVWLARILLAGAILFSVPGYLGALDYWNYHEAEQYAWAREVADLTEPDAVIMSYLYNDLLAVYGGRSVLNYRHIVIYDPANHEEFGARFATLLQAETERLLSRGTPLYYVRDQDPSWGHSYEILAQHFTLEPVNDKYKLFRVLR